MIAVSLNRMLAVGCEKRAKRMPVASAKPSRPTSDSRVTSTLAAEPDRVHAAVADGGEGLDAEEEVLQDTGGQADAPWSPRSAPGPQAK